MWSLRDDNCLRNVQVGFKHRNISNQHQIQRPTRMLRVRALFALAFLVGNSVAFLRPAFVNTALVQGKSLSPKIRTAEATADDAPEASGGASPPDASTPYVRDRRANRAAREAKRADPEYRRAMDEVSLLMKIHPVPISKLACHSC